MRKLILSLFILTLSFPLLGKTTHLIKLKNGERLKVDLHVYKNDRGMREMRIDSADIANVTLGFGRDINRNGVIETFFLKGKDGVHVYRKEQKGVSSSLMALSHLSVHSQYAGKDYYRKLARDFLGLLFFSMDMVNRAQNTYFHDFMDLEELEISAADKKHLLTGVEKEYVQTLVLKGHEIAHDKLKRSLTKAKLLIAADAALWLGGGVLLKGALTTVGVKRIAAGASATFATRVAVNTYPKALSGALRGLGAHGIVNSSKNLILRGFQGIKNEWRYIALSTGVQLGVESYINYHEIKDADPMQQAENLLAHEGIRENVAISVTDSLLMAGAVNMTKNKKLRFALLGMIGASTSAGVGTAMDGNQSGTRIAFDSGWAIGIDSTSMLVELKALHHFQEKAVKSKNPKFKIVGYGIVFISQVAGYWGYSKATKYVEAETELQQGQLMLVPIPASL